MKRILGLLLCLSLAFAMTPALADKPQTPQEAMIGALPASALEAGWLSYADYALLFAHTPGLTAPADVAAFQALRDKGEEQPLLRAMSAVMTGPAVIRMYLMMAGDILASSGIDLFQIERAIEAGQPPSQQLWLQGDINQALLRLALTRRGYLQAEGEPEQWSWQGDFDSGPVVDFDRRDLGFIFGGDLGRSFPVMITDDLLLSSPDGDLFRALAAGQTTPLADDAPLMALLAALTPKDQALTQLLLMRPEAAGMEQQPYSALAIAQVFEAGSQQVLIALALPDEAAARQAKDSLSAQIAQAQLRSSGQSLMGLLESQSLSLEEIQIIPGTQARRSLIIPFRTRTDNSSAFRTFINMVYNRDLDWLEVE